VTNASELLGKIEKTLDDSPDETALRQIREWLDDPAYLSELKRYAEGLNDPGSLVNLQILLRRLKRFLEDKAKHSEHQKDLLGRIGMGGGVGLATGSLIAAVHATFPPVVLISLAGGAWMTIMGYMRSKQVDVEQHLYKQLAERVSVISGVIHGIA
jgi:hypothetical protein